MPLEIASDAIQNGETVVFTREGRVIGGFEAFEQLAARKYEVQIEYDDDWMDDISRTHVNRAQEVIDDSDADAFEAKIDALLKRRANHLNRTCEALAEHTALMSAVSSAIQELQLLCAFLQPHLDPLCALHHYPPPEPELDPDALPRKEEDLGEDAHPFELPPEAESEPPKPVEQEEEKKEQPKRNDEEEEREPDQEAVNAQAKLQEGLKFPPIAKYGELVEIARKAGLNLGKVPR